METVMIIGGILFLIAALIFMGMLIVATIHEDDEDIFDNEIGRFVGRTMQLTGLLGVLMVIVANLSDRTVRLRIISHLPSFIIELL